MIVGGTRRLSVLVLVAVFLPLRAADGPTVLEKGLFSYQAPPGWTVQSTAKSKFQVALGPRADNFTPMLTVTIENFTGSIEDYIAACRKTLEGGGGIFVRVTLREKKPFMTAAGLDGVRVVYTARMKDQELQLVCYFFDGGSDKKLLATGTCLRNFAATDAPLFDSAIKGFTLE